MGTAAGRTMDWPVFGRATAPCRRAWALAALLATLTLPAAHAATIYKWTDDAGVTHFSSDPPPAGADAERIEVESGKRHFGPSGPSARVRQIRCRDFRGALEQLDAAKVEAGEREQWRKARERARAGVERWCEG